MTDNLINFRIRKNKTIIEISKDIGVSSSYYVKIEQAKRNPSYNFLIKFKEAFPDASIDKIFFDSN